MGISEGSHPSPQEYLISLTSKERALDLELGLLRLWVLPLNGVTLNNLLIFLSLSFLICQMGLRGVPTL